jgi:hypothetical protein
MIAHILASARYARVLRLLDLERKLILNGPLAGLKELVDRREAALAEILENESELPEAFLVALNARAERNGRLLHASLAGVKAGAAQVEQIRATSDQLRTYSSTGARIDVSAKPATRDQRA